MTKIEWVSTNKQCPPFRVNDDGVICTEKLLFSTEDKTVHIGYAIKTLEQIGESEFTDITRWYDQTGDRIENVDRWCYLPTMQEDEQ